MASKSRYTQEEKEQALQTLDDNFGDVTLTALQTNIPRRTLQDWKRMRKLAQQKERLQNRQDDTQQGQGRQGPPKKEDAQQQQISTYTQIRNRLLEHINTLVDVLIDDPEIMQARVISLTRLLDRVIKLEALTTHEQTEQRILIEYIHPDGTIHDQPHWVDVDQGEEWDPFAWRKHEEE